MQKTESMLCKVEKNSKYGRFLVASRDVRRGEVLLRESPVIVGPRVDSAPGCLECFTPLYPPRGRCPRCGVSPLCSRCQHDSLECQFFSGLSRKQKDLCLRANNQYLLPLRILLHLKQSEGEERYRRILELEAHQEARRNTEVWFSHQQCVVKLLMSCDLISAEQKDSELVQRLCGILDVNSFELRGPGGPLRGVYLEAALMSHDCVANVHLSVDDNFVMTVRACVDIPQGRPVLNNYTDPLQTTGERRRHLLEGKYFACECNRCEDPTELGTYVSALWCPKCRTGRVLEYTSSGNWACDSCNQRYSTRLIATTLSVARSFVESLDRSSEQQLETALKRLSSTFVAGHSLLLDLKQSLVAVFREQPPTRQSALRKVQLCRELLPTLRRIEPGISRLVGITLYELHVGLVTLAQGPSHGRSPEDWGCIQELREAEEVLKEALSQLVYEPTASPEGELARQAMHELKTLKLIIAKLAHKESKKDKKGKHKKYQ